MAASTADVSPDSCAETIVFVNVTNSVNIGKSVDKSEEDDPPNVPPVVPALDDDDDDDELVLLFLLALAAEAAPLARLFCVKVLAPAIIDINACCCAGLIVDVAVDGVVEVVFPVDGATTGGKFAI